jgi:hypothetical protein
MRRTDAERGNQDSDDYFKHRQPTKKGQLPPVTAPVQAAPSLPRRVLLIIL